MDLIYRAKRFFAMITARDLRRRMEKQYGVVLPADLPIEFAEILGSVRSYGCDADTLVDVGAFQGQFTRAACLFMHFDTVICVEPNPDLRSALLANAGPDVKIIQAALGSRTGETTYFMHQDSTMNSIVESDPDVLKAKFPYDNPGFMKTREVPVQTLDSLAASGLVRDTARVLLKIDTQGSELDVLRSGPRVLDRVTLCVVEHMFVDAYYRDYGFVDLVAFMEDAGLTCRGAVSISKRLSGEISSVDFIFTRTRSSESADNE